MSQTIAVIDYGSGNLHSAAKAVERAARDCGHETHVLVTSSVTDVGAADRIILPGVGAFADCKRGLLAVTDLRETLQDVVIGQGRPFLGICVGMQLMATRGLEFEVTEGLDWIPGDVRAITPNDPALKIPHMGWNTLETQRAQIAARVAGTAPHVPAHPLLAGIDIGDSGLHAYFVHSYHLVATHTADVVATTDYGGPITAMVARNNLAGTQFHPEKSQTLGLRLLTNFLSWRP
jgi:imidazole glycerol-phosphate synthase subunit HisH